MCSLHAIIILHNTHTHTFRFSLICCLECLAHSMIAGLFPPLATARKPTVAAMNLTSVPAWTEKKTTTSTTVRTSSDCISVTYRTDHAEKKKEFMLTWTEYCCPLKVIHYILPCEFLGEWTSERARGCVPVCMEIFFPLVHNENVNNELHAKVHCTSTYGRVYAWIYTDFDFVSENIVRLW